jgi:peptidoglycan/LPS O-acetylase OafA/YrhL
MPSRLWELGFSILLFQLEQKLHWPRFLPWLGLAGLLAAFSLPRTQGLQLATTPLAALSSAALIDGLLRPSLLQRLFSHSWPVAIGQRAYGLYLWHWPLLVYGKALWPQQT